jgi:dipeptide/tripeptide permease
MSTSTNVTHTANRREAVVGGALLVAIGVLVLLAQNIKSEDLGLLFLPALGGLFLIAGIIGRQAGFIIPGGILTGIGLGAMLTQNPAMAPTETAQGGVFFIGFALGWFLIPVLTKLFTHETHWWALIPGTIMALIGGALLLGGAALNVLEFVGRWWPLILVALGLTIIVRRK